MERLDDYTLEMQPNVLYNFRIAAAQLGWSDDTLSGMLIAGNTQDYVRCHAEALAATGEYIITSCQSDAIDNGIIGIVGMCDAVDLLLGMEEDDGHPLVKYKTFSRQMHQCLKDYAVQGGLY